MPMKLSKTSLFTWSFVTGWSLIFSVVAVDARETTGKRALTMEVVEPGTQKKPGGKSTTEADLVVVPVSDLSHEEQAQALSLRLSTQKALRTMQARRMASSRKQSKKAWRKDLEGFLTAQRRIQSRSEIKPTLPKRLPQTDPGLAPEPEPQELQKPHPGEPRPAKRPTAVLA
jgi:hypothetical protein